MDNVQTTKKKASFGQRTAAVMRMLLFNGLLIVVPAVAYYFAVIQRQSEFRVEQGFHALREVQTHSDDYLLGIDASLENLPAVWASEQDNSIAPKKIGSHQGSKIGSAKNLQRQIHLDPSLSNLADRFELRVSFDDSPDSSSSCAAGTIVDSGLTIWLDSASEATPNIKFRDCRNHSEKNRPVLPRPPSQGVTLSGPAQVLLNVPRALKRFTQIALVQPSGAVLATIEQASPPLHGSTQKFVESTAPPVDMKDLLQAKPTPARNLRLFDNAKTSSTEAESTRMQVLVAQGNSQSVIQTPEQKPGAPGLARIVKTDIAGTPYRVFIVPFHPPLKIYSGAPCRISGIDNDCTLEKLKARQLTTLYLVGFQPRSKIGDAASALGTAGSWYLLIAVLVAAGLWPLLRVLLLADHQAIARSSLAITTVSVVFLVGVGTVFFTATIEQRRLLALRDVEAAHYARRLAETASVEIKETLHQINARLPWYQAIDQGGGQLDPSPDVRADDLLACDGNRIKRGGSRTGTASSCAKVSPIATGYCHIKPALVDGQRPWLATTQILATNRDGKIAGLPMLTASACKSEVKQIDVSDRRYYLNHLHTSGWPTAPLFIDGALPKNFPERFVAERIVARTDGSRGLEVSVPRLLEVDTGNPQFQGVVGGWTAMYPFTAAIKAPFLSFAIVDNASGTVVFHSDDDASLQENFFAETRRPAALMTAVNSGQPASFRGQYRSELQAFSTHAVKGLPWTVITFHAVGTTIAPSVNAGYIALTQFAAVLLVVAVLGFLGCSIVLPLAHKWSAPDFRFCWQWLWPQWRLRTIYFWFAAGVFLLAIAAAASFWKFDNVLIILSGLSLGTLALWLSVLYWLSPKKPQERSREDSAQTQVGEDAGLRARWLADLRLPDWMSSPFNDPVDTLPEFRFFYRLALVSVLVLVAVVPVRAFYVKALTSLRDGELRLALREAADSFEQRSLRIADELHRNTGDPEGFSGRFPQPQVIARAERAVGFQCDAQGRFRWVPEDAEKPLGGVCPEARDGDVKDSGVPSMPEWPRFTFAALAPLLPGQIAVLDALQDDHFSRAPTDQVSNDIERRIYSTRFPRAGRVEMEAVFDPNPARVLRRDPTRRIFEAFLIGFLSFCGWFGIPWLLASLLSRRVLGVDSPTVPVLSVMHREVRVATDGRVAATFAPSAAARPFGPGQPVSRWWHLAASAAAKAPDSGWLQQQLTELRVDQTLDLARDQLPSTFRLLRSLLVLMRFDEAVLVPAKRLAVLDYLEARLERGESLILCSMSPPWMRLCRPHLFPEHAHVPDPVEALRWQALRRRFVVLHWESLEELTAGSWAAQSGMDRMLGPLLDEEAIALREVIGRMPQTLEPTTAAERPRDVRELELRALSEVKAELRREWAFCTTEERLALHQLAEGAIVNPLHRRVLDDLLIRRLAILAPEPRIACETLRNFVLNAEPAERFAEWSGLARGGPWDSIRGPFLILLLLLLAWFALSAGDIFNTLAAVLTGVAGLIANVSRVFGFTRGGAGTDR